MWIHHSKLILFTLVADNFGFKYDENQDTQYLIKVLPEHYKAVSLDWAARLFCGIKIDWDYKNITVDIIIPGYMAKLLQIFLHTTPKRLDHQLHQHAQPQYGTNEQLTETEDKTPLLQPMDITKLQKILRLMLYYARAVIFALMNTLNKLASTKANVTQATMRATKNLMNYCHTHSDSTIRYCASKKKLHIHRGASYLSESKARSRVGRHFFLSDHFNPSSPKKINSAVIVAAAHNWEAYS